MNLIFIQAVSPKYAKIQLLEHMNRFWGFYSLEIHATTNFTVSHFESTKSMNTELFFLLIVLFIF